MARLTRKNIKVFAENATNNGIFGSLQANDPTTTNDVEQIQSLPAWSNGWDDATMTSEELPPLEEFQGIQYVVSYEQAYLMQEGLPEWSTSVTYFKGSLVKNITPTGFQIYNSLTDNNTGNLLSDTSNWKLVMDSDNLYAFDSAVVHKAGNETISGVKTFSSSPVVPNGSGSTDAVNKGQLDTKANNNAVVHLTGNENISGSKTFTGTLGIPSDNLITKQDNAMEGGQINFEKPTNSSLTGNANIDIYGNWMRFLGRNSSNNYTTPLRLDLETNTTLSTPSSAVDSVVTTTGISKSENGFVKLGNGIIIQWGRKPSYVSPDPQSVTFPTPFTSTNYKVVCTYFRTGGSVDSGKDQINVDTQSTTGFTFRMSDTATYGVNWIAIGY